MRNIEMTEDSYLIARAEMRSTFISILIGVAIGIGIGYMTNRDAGDAQGRIYTMVAIALVFAGVPYVWKHFPYIALGWLSLLLKIIVSMLVGWIITPVVLMWQFIQMKSYELRLARQIRQDAPGESGLEGGILEGICTCLCVVAGISFIIAGLIITKGNLDANGSLTMLTYESYIILTSILWVVYRSSRIVGFFDLIMDILTAWFLRHVWLLLWLIIGESVKFAPLLGVVFAWDALIFIDALVYLIRSLFQKKVS